MNRAGDQLGIDDGVKRELDNKNGGSSHQEGECKKIGSFLKRQISGF